jgi:hypothetical protein
MRMILAKLVSGKKAAIQYGGLWHTSKSVEVIIAGTKTCLKRLI